MPAQRTLNHFFKPLRASNSPRQRRTSVKLYLKMDDCPAETLHQICDLLDFDDVASFRQVCRSFADVGAEHLISKVRFHCTTASLERLKAIASHHVFRNQVKFLVFEGNVLADIGCEHAYASHYDLDHHRDEKPKPPPEGCTKRERRLYERNLVKFESQALVKYEKYRATYTAQQQLIHSDLYGELISTSVSSFPRLEHVSLSTSGRCRHVLSQRFLEDFAVDCAMPMDPDTSHTKIQFQHMLFPHGIPTLNLKQLDAHVLSPSTFGDTSLTAKFMHAFSSLQRIELNFRMESYGRLDLELGVDWCYSALSKGVLHAALAAAVNLERLTINFDDFGYYGSCMNITHALGETSWPKLKDLDIDCVCADGDVLMSALERQPALRDLNIGFFTLNKGLWSDVIKSMQQNLSLDHFRPTGVLDDPDNVHSMHHIDADAYMTDYLEFTASEALEMFVCDEAPEDDFVDPYNPLIDMIFDDPEELKEQFGSIYDSDMECDSDVSDMDCD